MISRGSSQFYSNRNNTETLEEDVLRSLGRRMWIFTLFRKPFRAFVYMFPYFGKVKLIILTITNVEDTKNLVNTLWL